MDEKTRRLDLRLLLAVTAVVAVVLTMWASGAFAAGGSSGSSDPPTNGSFLQIQEDGQAQRDEDCPEDAGGSGGSDDSGSGSSNL